DALLENFSGKSVEEIDVRAVQKSGFEYFIPSVREALKTVKTSELILSGAKGLLENQDITSTEQLKNLLDIIENREMLETLFREVIEEKTHIPGIKIGSEFREEALQDYAVICTEFGFRDSDKGFIGIIGPKRMNYAYNGALVVGYSNALTELFTGIYL
ncbi:MAG: HrcA family transcriptional regulator, partial [Bacillota bacterium]|nr:HrcA family transcriptional regulator [Bacillota bacterium]